MTSTSAATGWAGNVRATVKGLYIYAVLGLIVVVFSVAKLGEVEPFGPGHFLGPDSVVNMLRTAAPILTLGGAFTLLMIAGYIDLSVGSAMSLAAVVFALLARQGVSFGPALLATLVLGVGFGALNGLLVMRLRITPVIATLVTLCLFKGIALLVVPDGVSAIKGLPGQPMPPWINDYARAEVLLDLPWSFYVAVGIILALVVVQRRTIVGRYAAAIGGNRTAAELAGIDPKRWVGLLYVLVGACAAAAGVARASYMSLGDPLSGDGMELDCIIAVLLGGTSFSGGEGSVAKTVVGALIIVCLTTGLMTVIPAFWQTFAKGTVLVSAVALNHLLTRERPRL